VGWPQTIADADCLPQDPGCIDIDFDLGRDDEDLRAFLTVLGTAEETFVSLELGAEATRVWRPDTGELLDPNVPFEVTLGPFDVLNLETDGLNQDFTGTQIDASLPVTVFVGGEASDAPRFDSYTTRQCCADHLEDQLMSNATLGSSFLVARMTPRTVALNNAFLDPLRDSVAEVNEPEFVRVQAVGQLDGTVVTTTLPPPDDRFTLDSGQSRILRAEQDFSMSALDGRPIAVLQVLPSQQAIGIPSVYPGGDPAIVVVPPREQYRQDYVFLTPDRYAFDFVTITAPANATIQLDGEEINDRRCEVSPADGIPRLPADPPALDLVYRCQLSFPEIANCDPNAEGCIGGVRAGEQNDGVHTVLADQPVGVVVYGFDSFVSYAYAAGLNLIPIPR
ncbi:MAG: IgGFc-binding protein, partial [Myxococcota bacterium]